MMIEAVPNLISIAVLWFAAVAAPGPNFFVVTRTSLTNGRPVAMTVAVGMALGAGVWGLAGFFSIHALFAVAPWLYLVLKLVGAAYLMWLGTTLLLRSFRSDPASISPPRPVATASALRIGLVTSLANPREIGNDAVRLLDGEKQHCGIWRKAQCEERGA